MPEGVRGPEPRRLDLPAADFRAAALPGAAVPVAGLRGERAAPRFRPAVLRALSFRFAIAVRFLGRDKTPESTTHELATRGRALGVIVIVADGARPDIFQSAVASGALPALAAMRAEGALHTITTCAPSVTGPAYAPLLMGRYPAPVGLPGLRWYDRSRRVCRLPGHSRSYVGIEMQHVDDDLDPSAPTIYELAPSSIGALSVITRGLPRSQRIGYGPLAKLRTGITHFRGRVDGWHAIDAAMADQFAARVLRENPAFAFAALTGIDKASHAAGAGSPLALDALRIVDRLVNRLRSDLQSAGRWSDTHLWVVSDHGHVDVREHEDLVRVISGWGHSVRAHPWVYSPRGDVAVMVSGNALAHLYVDLTTRVRRWWPRLAASHEPFVQQLLARESVDLLLLPHSAELTEVRARGRGTAMIEARAGRYSYRPRAGDPLRLGELRDLDRTAAHEATIDGEYPDALVQIAALCAAERSGDVIVSAARDWDLRARFEPIPHVSSHGALHRGHMLVPLLMNRTARTAPKRTVDIFPSALAALGIAAPDGLDGESFL